MLAVDGNTRRRIRPGRLRTRVGAAGAWFGARVWRVLRLGPLVVCAALVVAVWRQMGHADYFRLRCVDVQAGDHVDKAELQSFVATRVGQNIFTVDMRHLAQRLRAYPWIKTAVIRRELPNTLRVEIVERRAASLLLLEQSYLVDEDGFVFKHCERGDPQDLPRLVGFSAEAFNHGGEPAEREAKRIAEGVRLMRLCQRLNALPENDISEVRYDVVAGYSLITAETGMVVRVGEGDYERKLKSLARLSQSLRERLAQVKMVDLAINGRVVVRGLRKGTDA